MDTKNTTPKCVAIIMDGNRRFARERGMPQLVGHKMGLSKMKEVIGWAFDAGVRTIILYAFSTENWKRSKEEVGYLMKLFTQAIENELEEVRTRGARIRFIGDLSQLPEQVRASAERLQEDTKDKLEGTVAIALSYGARAEIAAAAQQLVSEGVKEVTEESFRAVLGSADLPDPDIIIRTGGEHRLSNFLLYQAAYSELFFTDTKWPAFSHEEFNMILQNFAQRGRNYGQ